VGLPLCFLWLFFEAGLIEEFFYRSILQSRLSVLLRSPTGGIVVSALIFGLSHAPGLYLRGAESEGIDEQLPLLFWSAYTIAFMSIAGIFLGIVWQRTRNLWVVMALHTMIDLLPNLGNFLKTWGL
jgi:membrane protease YdiL (CAAX protease family)